MFEFFVVTKIKDDMLKDIVDKKAKQASGSPSHDTETDGTLTVDEQTVTNIYNVVVVVLFILIFMAFYRALIVCSGKSTDSKALHLLFALYSPLIYLLFSFTTCGFDGVEKSAPSVAASFF